MDTATVTPTNRPRTLGRRRHLGPAEPGFAGPGHTAVEVVTPDEYLGDVIGNLNGRRGRVEQLEPVGASQSIKASVPLSEMFGYATDLRSMSQGRATFTMQFDRYEEVPMSIAEAIVGGEKTA